MGRMARLPWPGLAVLALCALFWASTIVVQGAEGPFSWMGYDKFDEVTDRMDAVNMQNCRSKPASELHLPKEVLAQVPRFNKLLSTIIYPNRTDMLHVHNMALNRAFFYSYIFQKLNTSETFQYQPGLMYYYFSAAADISANEYNINGSAVFFDNNCSYANWYRNLPFNHTLNLFGPRAWRFDDYNDPTNWLREPTNTTIDIIDYGAGAQSNYTLKSYKINQWYDQWLPDDWDMEGLDSVRKHSYDVGVKYSNATGQFENEEWEGKTFFGPPSPGQKETEHLPVVFTAPYYDCGRSNKWIVSGVSPVVDQLPRYLDWFHLRRFRFVASVSMDMDFLSIDMNQCPIGIGNELPNYFAGTDRCKETTMCEPLYGWGFRRGGYQCMCKPGYRYPPWQHGPFQGIEIESATKEEYDNGFDCIPVELRQVIPVIRGNDTGLYNRKKREAENSHDGAAAEQVLLETPGERVKRDADEPVHVVEPIQLVEAPSGESKILNKQKRFLRSVGLKEVKEETVSNDATPNRIKRKVVPRQDYVPETAAQKLYRERRSERTARKPRFVPRHPKSSDTPHSRRKRNAFDQEAWDRMNKIIMHKESVNSDNCLDFKEEDLQLPGDVSYNVENLFSAQARTALRLSHFLSNFLQNVDMYEEYGNLRGDNLLNIEQIFGEVLANVMGDLRLKGSGVFFDIDKFRGPDGKTRQFFGPYAYRYEDFEEGAPPGDRANTHFRAVDFAGNPKHYLDEPWFKNVKERWQSNTYGLTKFTEKPMIRSDLAGTSSRKFELYPMYYRAPREIDGWWSHPYFDCDGYVNDWIITYSIPFFGKNSIGTALEFKGVVVVDVKLDELDINQCPTDYHVANAFGNTARCHFESTYCFLLPGKKFVRGSYKCECLQGWEYPFNDRAWYFDGQTMEEEYRKYEEGDETNRYETLKCRMAGAGRPGFSWVLLVFVTMFIKYISK